MRHTLEQFWPLVQRWDHPQPCLYCCWPWLGPQWQDGSGKFQVSGVPSRVHRVAWELWHQRPLPSERMGCHYCHTRLCANPLPIHPGTQKDNLADARRDGRMPFGARHWAAKITEADIPVIFQLHDTGMSQRAIARRYATPHQNIRGILRRETWRHVLLP